MVASQPGACGLLSSSPRTLPSLLSPVGAPGFVSCLQLSGFILHGLGTGASCPHFCSSPLTLAPTSNFLSSPLSYLMAFFLPCLPEASALMLPYGSPALCEHASLLLLELSLKTFKGTALSRTDLALEELASLILAWVSGGGKVQLTQTWQTSS